MTNPMSTGQKPRSGPPRDPREVERITSSYRSKLADRDRIRGEISAEKTRQDRDRAELKDRLKTAGIANSKELKEKIEELKSRVDPNFYRVESEFESLQTEIRRLEGEKRIYEEQLANSSEKIEKFNRDRDTYDRTLAFLRDVSDVARANIVSRIEDFVTKALDKIFSPGLLRFKIEMKTKQNIPNANFLLQDCVTNESFDILDSFGGGVGDVVSTVLRLAILEMQDPANTGPVILDEVGKFLSDDRQERFGEFLKEWSIQFNRQVILITHKPGILKSADRIFKVSKVDSVSKVENVEHDGQETIRTETIRTQSK